MAGKIANGLELTKQCWHALKSNPQLLWFPVISGMGLIAVTVVSVGVGAGAAAGVFAANAQNDSTVVWVVSAVWLFIYYLLAYTAIIYSNTALVAAAMRLVRGESAGVRDGLAVANKRFGRIVFYAVISATIGVFAKSARGNTNSLGGIALAIAGGLVQGAWTLVVFFALPVMVAEDTSIRDTFAHSLALFKKTWGEGFTGRATIGLVGLVGGIVVLLLGGAVIALGLFTNLVPVAILGVIVIVLGLASLALLDGAINGVLQASLYQYAVSGDAGIFVDTKLAAGAFSA
jgi:hypothetical protein